MQSLFYRNLRTHRSSFTLEYCVENSAQWGSSEVAGRRLKNYLNSFLIQPSPDKTNFCKVCFYRNLRTHRSSSFTLEYCVENSTQLEFGGCRAKSSKNYLNSFLIQPSPDKTNFCKVCFIATSELIDPLLSPWSIVLRTQHNWEFGGCRAKSSKNYLNSF